MAKTASVSLFDVAVVVITAALALHVALAAWAAYYGGIGSVAVAAAAAFGYGVYYLGMSAVSGGGAAR